MVHGSAVRIRSPTNWIYSRSEDDEVSLRLKHLGKHLIGALFLQSDCSLIAEDADSYVAVAVHVHQTDGNLH